MAVSDYHGLPVALWVGSASPGDVTLDDKHTVAYPERLVSDMAYDSDEHDGWTVVQTRRLGSRGVELGHHAPQGVGNVVPAHALPVLPQDLAVQVQVAQFLT
jgi:hypothetical protein